MIRAWQVLLVLSLAACGGGGDGQGGDAVGADGLGGLHGSCLQPDNTVDPPLETCVEKEEPLVGGEPILCQALGGTWRELACSPAGYARKCTVELGESQGELGMQTVHYVYYYQEGSKAGCLGTVTEL
jgi:hypothetical protein